MYDAFEVIVAWHAFVIMLAMPFILVSDDE